MKLLKHHCVIFVFLTLLALPGVACEKKFLIHPSPGSQIRDLQPELKWSGSANENYRVQVVAVQPETRVILSIDTIVQSNHFKLPSALPSNFAAVKVLVSQNCIQLDAQDVNAQGPSFFVNSRTECSLSKEALRQNNDSLVWEPIQSANSYVVRFFRAEVESDGGVRATLLSTTETRDAHWDIRANEISSLKRYSAGDRKLLIVSVQAVCNGMAGGVEQVVLASAP